MFVRPIALAAALMLGACAENPVKPIPQDGTMSRRITWVITDDPGIACRGERPQLVTFGVALGCADWKDPNHCVIYLRAPTGAADRRGIETLGHEVLHCFVGRFHPPGPG